MAVGIVEYVVIMAGGPSRGLSEQLPSQHIPEILLLEAEYDRFAQRMMQCLRITL